jgi:hypothetical protein
MTWVKWVLAAGVTVGLVVVLGSKGDLRRYIRMRDM